jgi:hypothetical protein
VAAADDKDVPGRGHAEKHRGKREKRTQDPEVGKETRGGERERRKEEEGASSFTLVSLSPSES